MKRVFVMTGLFFALMGVVMAQVPSPTAQEADQENKKNDVFLDNHRSLNPKREKAPTSRTVSGIVSDDTGQPLDGALVTVTQLKTNSKRTFFTKKDGRYSFTDLAFTEDYTVQAKWKALISEPRKISQYDHSAKAVRLLQVGTPEGYAAPAKPASEAKQEQPKN